MQSSTFGRNSLGPRVWVGQQELADCGLASLAMIARSRGRRVTVEDLRAHAPPSERGLSLLELERVARGLGLPCRAVRVAGARLGEVTLPALAHLEEGHYVVVYEQGAGVIALGDPACGLVTLSRGEFLRRYSGHLLLFSPAAAGHGEGRS
jgi:ABC-type bacteriocin/lantibiotic exporter with double-glycine peptidase domain